MSSLYVDRRGIRLDLDGEALVFYENNERVGTVPITPLDRVFLRGDINLSTSLLGKLGAHGVGVIILSGRKSEANLMLAKPHNDASRRVAQYHLSLDSNFCLRFAQCIVELKLRGQHRLLSDLIDKNFMARYELTVRCRQVLEAIAKINDQQNLASLRGLEGHAAAAYFSGLVAHLPNSLGFSGRNRRPPKDPINVVLSLAYTMLHADAVVTLYGSGLDPYIGFYHSLDFSRESLACDLIETLRPQVDRFVLNLFASGDLRVEDFSNTAQGCLIGKAGRARFYPLYERAAEHFRKSLTDAVDELIESIKQYGLPSLPQARQPQRVVDDVDDDEGEF